MLRHGLLLVVGIFASWVAPSYGACAAKFKQDAFEFPLEANETFTQSLRALLVDPLPSTTLNFQFIASQPPPPWANLEGGQNQETLRALPPATALGLHQTTMFVSCGADAGGATAISFRVKVPPKWTSPALDIAATEDAPYTIDLKSMVTTLGDPSKLVFSASNLPTRAPWLNLNGSVLSGTPRRINVGTFSGITLTVSDPSGGSSSIPARGEVVKVTRPPKWASNPIILSDGEEGAAYNQPTRLFVSHTEPEPGNLFPLKFQITESNRTWVKIDPNSGAISGSPGFSDSGSVSLKVKVSFTEAQKEYSDTTTFQFVVKNKNRAPQWTQAPVFTATEDTPFQEDLSPFAQDGDVAEGDTLRFEITASPTPAWASLSQSGKLFRGTPSQNEVGPNIFRVKVTDAAGLSSETQVTVNVGPANDPPVWSQATILLPDAIVGKPYNQSIAGFASDPDNNVAELKFSKVNPNDAPWSILDSSGGLTGTPKKSEEGNYQFSARVQDPGGLSATVTVIVKVVFINTPPEWAAPPTFNAKEDTLFKTDLSSFVTDPDLTQGDTLRFEVVSSPTGNTWATISTDGKNFGGTPLQKDIGANQFVVKVSDAFGGSVSQTINVQVAPVNDAPTWKSEPIRLPDAIIAKDYSQSLSPFAEDVDNTLAELTFEKVTGPGAPWVTISLQGGVTGIPQKAHEGLNTFRAKVTDPDGLAAIATVEINVRFVNTPPTWDPIPQFTATEDTQFDGEVKPFAKDPDTAQGDILKFSLVQQTPSWLSVNETSGKISGTPLQAHVGLQSFKIRVTDNFGGSADTNFTILVGPTNDAPNWKQDPIILPNGSVGTPYTQDLKLFVEDVDNSLAELKFEKVGQDASWITVSPQGVVSGLPLKPNEGPNSFQVKVTDPGNLSDTATVQVTITEPKFPPSWTKNPIPLGNVAMGKVFNFDLKPFLTDGDTPKDQLVCSKKAGALPAWLEVKSDCTVTGTPQVADLGPFTTSFVVTDGISVAETDGTGTVVNGFPPSWTQNPIPLGNAQVGKGFNFDLKPFLTDGDTPKDQLVCSKKAGALPAWLEVKADCTVTGTPQTADLGPYTTTFVVTDGVSTAEADGKGTVIKGNRPPTINPAIVLQVREDETLVKDLHHPDFLWDADGEEISCMALEIKDFIRLAEDCTITLNPKHKDLGFHTYRIRVSDATESVDGMIGIEVLENADPPYWKKNPIDLVARVNQPFNHCVGNQAVDPKNRPLTFSCTGEPPFVKCQTNGCLQGTATAMDLGLKQFNMIASNGSQTAETLIRLMVVEGQENKRIRLGEPVPGARAENLWLVDTSPYSCPLVKAVRNNIGVYYQALRTAQINHTGIFLSTDARPRPDGFAGRPIEAGGRKLIHWQDNNLVSDFLTRTEVAYTNNCYSTPTWTSKLFYNLLPSMSDIYKTKFFEPSVPMDAITVTCQRDHYERYTGGYTPERFAEEFVAIHQAEGKQYRFNVIAPSPSQLDNNSGGTSTLGPADTYERIADTTNGKYYSDGILNDMNSILKDLAARVILSAYIHAKKVIPLNPAPSNPSTITVTLAGQTLAGNTGNASDAWTYQASPPAIVMHWDRIDLSNVDANDYLEIEYTARGKNLQRLSKN